MKISCPSKTFLVGEYAVLDGGPAILLATPPYFMLEDDLTFVDPYHGAGGFGASGAKFVLSAKKNGEIDHWQVWEKYRSSGFEGSGADVVAQWMGGITFFYPQQRIIENITWPFGNLSIGLIHTGYKIQTHEHLQELKNNNFALLKAITIKTYQALKQSDQINFLKSIQDYAVELDKFHLVCDNTKWILDKIKNCPSILAAKGCGALGADVILTVIEKSNQENFLDWAAREKLNVVYCDNQFAGGVSCV